MDSSVLLDVLTGHPAFGPPSRETLRTAYDAGALVASEVVWAEVRAHFAAEEPFREAMDLLGVRFDAITAQSAAFAGELWRASRRSRSGMAKTGRKRVVADFLVGAHALHQAERLLTRDERFYRARFAGLNVLGPSAHR